MATSKQPHHHIMSSSSSSLVAAVLVLTVVLGSLDQTTLWAASSSFQLKKHINMTATTRHNYSNHSMSTTVHDNPPPDDPWNDNDNNDDDIDIDQWSTRSILSKLAAALVQETLHEDPPPQAHWQHNHTLPQKPLVWNAGHGTTGTRTLFQALCLLKIPGLHYKANCHILTDNPKVGLPTDPLEYPRPRGGKKSLPQLSRDEQAKVDFLQDTFAHFFFEQHDDCQMQLMQKDALPPNTTQRQPTAFCVLNARAWLRPNLMQLNRVIRSGLVDQLMDTPYPYHSSYLLEAVQPLRGGQILVLSTRNSTEWAVRRLADHDKQTLCQPDQNRGGDLKLYLDYGECYAQAVRLQQRHWQQQGHTAAADADDSDIVANVNLRMIRFHQLRRDLGQSKAVEVIADALDRHQASLQTQADYVVNVFAHQPRLEVEGWAQNLAQALPQLCRYWDCSHVLETSLVENHDKINNGDDNKEDLSQ